MTSRRAVWLVLLLGVALVVLSGLLAWSGLSDSGYREGDVFHDVVAKADYQIDLGGSKCWYHSLHVGGIKWIDEVGDLFDPRDVPAPRGESVTDGTFTILQVEERTRTSGHPAVGVFEAGPYRWTFTTARWACG
jgi:hypothetical protein